MCRLRLLTCFVIQLGRLCYCSARSEHTVQGWLEIIWALLLLLFPSWASYSWLDHATAALHCRMYYRQPLLLKKKLSCFSGFPVESMGTDGKAVPMQARHAAHGGPAHGVSGMSTNLLR
jgi:hypothetical protein